MFIWKRKNEFFFEWYDYYFMRYTFDCLIFLHSLRLLQFNYSYEKKWRVIICDKSSATCWPNV